MKIRTVDMYSTRTVRYGFDRWIPPHVPLGKLTFPPIAPVQPRVAPPLPLPHGGGTEEQQCGLMSCMSWAAQSTHVQQGPEVQEAQAGQDTAPGHESQRIFPC